MQKYIPQNITKYNDFEHYSETFEDSYMSYFDEKRTSPDFYQLYNIKYLMIVAEPGYGKTRLFKELVLKANDNSSKVFFIDSKQIKNSIVDSIKKCKIVEESLTEEKLQKKVYLSNVEDCDFDENTIICLDALDEIPFSRLYNFFEQVEEFISDYPNVKVFLSCRTHHLKKIEYDLTNISFEYITLENFYGKQVIEYLKNNGLSEFQINEIEEKSHLTNLGTYLSIPRYLYYFSELIKNRDIKEVMNLSRSEIFEEFIYRKIDKERSKEFPESENYTIKRVLEELALVMKIFQVSQISIDDFFTVFKELNLSNIFIGEGLIEKLTNKSLLKDNIDYLEFENQEFLDFLAAKELSRFEKVEQVFFDMAVEPHFKEVYTSWFYVMPFVLEQHPHLINIILDFLEKNSNKVLRENYFDVITSIDTKRIDENTKDRIFNIVFDYCYEHNQWLPYRKLIYFYIEEKHYSKILESINSDINEDKVRRRNAIELIEEISEHKGLSTIQLDFWKDKFLEWLKLEPKTYKNLHATIVSSCAIIMKNDFDWIKEVSFIFEEGIEVQHEYSRTCNKIAPNDKFSIDIYFKCDKQFKKNQLARAGRLDDNVKYLCNIDSQEGLEYLLKKLILDDSKKYLNYLIHESYRDKYQNDLKTLTTNICLNLNEVIYSLLKELVLHLLIEIRIKYNESGRYLFSNFLQILINKDEDYIFELVDLMYGLYTNGELVYWDFEEAIIYDISKYFTSENFDKIHKKLEKINDDKRDIKNLISAIYYQNDIDYNVKNTIYKLYKEEFELDEEKTKKYKEKRKRDDINRQIGLCKQWHHKLEPEQGNTDLFRFYKNNKESLSLCNNFEENRRRTIELAKSIIKHNNPLNGKIKINGNSSTVWGVHYYKDVIDFLYDEKIELKLPEEQNLIDNIFRYLPFDINSDYKSTLKLAYNPSQEAIQDILDVYAGEREDDLDISHPENFIEIYKSMRISEAEDLLLKMLNNSEIRDYIRERIINVLPKEKLTKEFIKEYISTKGENDELYENMLIALVKNFNDKETIKTIFNLVIKKGKETEIQEGVDKWDTALDLDRTHNKLAHTLMKTDYDIEEDKKLLEFAVELREKGKDVNADYFEQIVFSHLKYLNNKKSFEPLIEIEKFLQSHNLNWFEYKFKELKDIYLNEISKPTHIIEAIKTYKKAKENEYLTVKSSLHLMEIIKDAITKDIRNWIEMEGAYKHIEELAKKDKNLNAEDFIQKSLKPQIELALLKRGLRDTDIRIKREEQLINDKRTDFTVSYGFMGQILLELKLSHSNDATDGKKGQEYKKTIYQYMSGTNSDYGLFIIFNIRQTKDTFKKRIDKLIKLYEKDEGIYVLDIDCKVN